MRVVVIVHGFPPQAGGGSEIYAESQARALRRLYGDDVLVIAREADDSRDEYAERTESRDGMAIVWINNTFRNVRSFAESYRNDTIAAIANRHIERFGPDVASIHHLTCLSTGIVPALVRRNIPSVYTLHDYWLMCHRGQLLDRNCHVCDGPVPSGCRNCIGAPATAGAAGFAGAAAVRTVERLLPDRAAAALRRTAARVAERLFASDDGAEARARDEHMRAVTRDITHFLAPSEFMRRRCEAFGVSEGRTSRAGYGVDATPFNAVSRAPSDRLRIGFLGSLMISKAPHVLLETFGRLPRGLASLDLYGSFMPYHGDDSYRSRVEPLVHQPGVRVHGTVPHEHVPEMFSSIDVLVVPSIWPENSPFVIREAFLAGVPVVASRIGGIPELVTDGVSGLLVEPGDVDALYRALLGLATDRARLDRLRQHAPAVTTIEEDTADTRALFERLVATRPRT